MAEAPKTYIIQLRENPNFCLGIDSAVAGARVTLHRLGTTVLTQWVMDPETDYIRPVKNTNLVLDVEGNTWPDRRPIIIADPIPGRMAQKWDWVSSPGRILNKGIEAHGIGLGNYREVLLLHIDLCNEGWLPLPIEAVEKMLLATAGKPE